MLLILTFMIIIQETVMNEKEMKSASGKLICF